jgi:MinD superfamily P-loop ATPase
MSRTWIAIASGKGGTGKTTVATNLAAFAAASGRRVQLLDCDVEAPNAHLFLRPKIEEEETIGVPVPHVDLERCNDCGECGSICRFSAIVSLKTKPLVFPELCHGCGGCMRVCPTDAITERPREVGRIEKGRAGDILFAGGRLRVGEAQSPPLIRAVKKLSLEDGLVIIDAPPGNSCPVIEAVRHVHYVVLVTEPTPFGRNDLEIAVETMRELDLPFGVVVNRAAPGRDRVRDYCRDQRIEMLAELPDRREIAEAYSRGELAIQSSEEFRTLFGDLLEQVERRGALRSALEVKHE